MNSGYLYDCLFKKLHNYFIILIFFWNINMQYHAALHINKVLQQTRLRMNKDNREKDMHTKPDTILREHVYGSP